MKRILLTIIISFIAIFYTGCDLLEEALADFSGCTLEDAPNYDGSKTIPCATGCINGQTGANCCCEEIIYGCMDETAPNYANTGKDCDKVLPDDLDCANSACVEIISGVETPNACCDFEEVGCTKTAASNFVESTNVTCDDGNSTCVNGQTGDNCCCTYYTAEVESEDGTTTTVNYGCMNSDACNYIEPSDPTAVYGDCNAENADITGSDWVQNDVCCDMEKNASCYKDLNNNGFYEEVNTSANKCNCGELGVGWVSEDRVASDPEVQGCMSAMIGVQPCIEYNPNANVDNGSCCLSSFEDLGLTEEQITDIENLITIAGQYNLEFVNGWVDDNGDCIEDTMMMAFGPSISQLTLAANGSLQLYEEYLDSFDSRPEWEYRAEGVNNEMACGDKADQEGADYWFCANWGTNDFEVCEDLYLETECNSRQDCHFEKNFCQPTFEGMPCDQIMDEYQCEDTDCDWKDDEMGAHCVFPMHEPWMDCILLDEWECEENEACEVAEEAGYGDYDDDYDYGDYDDYIDCFEDCPEADFSGVDYDDYEAADAVYCQWYAALLDNSSCLTDCDANYDGGYTTADLVGFIYAIECNENLPSEECEEIIDDYYYGYDYDYDDYYGYDYDDYYDDDSGSQECLDDCGDVVDFEEDPEGFCSWVLTLPANACTSDCDPDILEELPEFVEMCTECLVNNDCEEMFEDGGGPPECVEDCAGIDEHEPEDGTPFCEWIVALDDSCLEDCEHGEDCIIELLEFQCEACLEFNICDEVFGDDYYYNYGNQDSKDDDVKLKDALNKIGEKLFEKAKLNSNAFARSSECDYGYVTDCADDDCCPESWIGDGFADCQDQAFDCDLSCYENDGGDCVGFVSMCEPSHPCFDNDSQTQCGFNQDCDWIFAMDECQPKPSGMQGGPNCGQYTQQGQCSNAAEGCEWMPPGPNGEPSMCGPKSCNSPSYNNQNDCNDSPVCAWQPPDWVDPWAVGACMQNNPCDQPLLQDPGSCDDPSDEFNCAWDWDEWHCVGAGDQQGGMCECLIAYTKNTCNASNGTWQLAPWAEQGDDAYECMVPMIYQDCYYDHQDVCNQFYSEGNQQTYWDESSHTCTKSFSFAEGGDWYIDTDTDDICLYWEEIPDPACSTLMSEETCYCFDCEWDMTAHTCGESSMGRVTEQYKMHKYQEMVMELSGSGSDEHGECFAFTFVDNVIRISTTWDEYENQYCQEISLIPVP